MTLVDNARYEPEQILFVSSSCCGKGAHRWRTAYVLPLRHPNQPEQRRPYQWTNSEEVGKDISISRIVAAELCRLMKVETPSTASNFAHLSAASFVSVKDGIQGMAAILQKVLRRYPSSRTYRR
jgi:hypothetical protein